MYEVRKSYDHSLGISCCFRQWRAKSHCHFMHGYALRIVLVFQNKELNENNWVTDFGGLKEIKQWIMDTFDHKTLVAEDDPMFDAFLTNVSSGLIDMVVVKATGCEAFAKMIYDYVHKQHVDGVMLSRVEVHEHNGNMAAYESAI